MDISRYRSLLSMVILAVLALAVVIFVGYKASTAFTEIDRLADQPTYFGTKKAIQHNSFPAQGWKEYRDNVFGYAVKYPEELRPDFESISPFATRKPTAHVFFELAPVEDGDLSGAQSPGFYIAVFPKSQKTSQISAIESRVKNSYNIFEFRADLIQDIKDPVIMYRMTSALGTHYIAYFWNSNYFFEVAASGDYEVRQVQDFISTFSFTK